MTEEPIGSAPFSTKSMTANRIGKYQLLRELGRGGMGVVYLAHDFQLERSVALKCLYEHPTHPQKTQPLSLKEAKILARLNHPNIVQIYDCVDSENGLALVMEYVKGQSLSEHLTSKRYTSDQALAWLSEIAQALVVAHDLGVIHRDLKADNIIISDSGHIKVADFGIARLQGDAQTHQALNMASYLSLAPEQLNGAVADAQSDLFALGVLAYQLFCGGHPFGECDNTAQFLHRLVKGEFIAPQEHNPELDVGLSDLICTLLAKTNTDRPDTAQDVVNQLNSHLIDSAQGLDTPTYGVIPVTRLITGPIAKSITGATSHPRTAPPTRSNQGGVAPTVPLKPMVRQMSATVPIKAPVPLLKRTVLICVALVGIVLAGLLSRVWWQGSPSQYVAISLSTSDSNPSQYASAHKQTAAVVNDALTQFVIREPNLALIPREDMKVVKGVLTERMQRLNADIWLQIELDCQELRCDIQLSRLDKDTKGINQTRQFSTLADNPLNTFEITAANVAQILNQAASGREGAIEEQITAEDYAEYLVLDERYEHGLSLTATEVLAPLDKLMTSSPKYLPLYQLYLKAARMVFIDTNNKVHLINLSQKLASAQRVLPESTTFHALLFELHHALGDAEKSTAHLQVLISSGNIRQENLLFYRGRLAALQGDRDEAIRLFEQSLRFHPSLGSLRALGFQQWLAGDLTVVKKTLQTILKISEQDDWALSLSASLALSKGDLSEAAKQYKTLLTFQKRAENYGNLGLVYMLTREYLKAKKQFELAIQLAPERLDHLLNLADAEYLLGNTKIADQQYHDIIAIIKTKNYQEIQSDTLSDLLNLAQAYAHTRQNQLAINTARALVENHADNPNVLFTAALVYTLLGEHQSALSYVDSAQHSGMGEVWFNLPWFEPLCRLSEFEKQQNICLQQL